MIDTDTLRASIDLLALAERDTQLKHAASTNGGEWHGPCPFCGGRDRFAVQPNADGGGRWHCRNCGGDQWHDAIGYIMRREPCDFRRACELLGAIDDLPSWTQAAPAQPDRLAGPPGPTWQAKADEMIQQCVAALWSDAGAKARGWLAARGLSDATLKAWRIGFNAADRWESSTAWGLPEETNADTGKPRKVWLPHGIVIPCEVGGTIWYVKVRRATGKPKYAQVTGGHPALFGAETLAGHDIAVLCEGEFDVMLLHQHVGDLVGVATLGSEGNRLDVPAWAAYLLPVSRLLIAYDVDGKSKRGAGVLVAMTARARRLTVPKLKDGDKDITDYHKSGGHLRDWLLFELARLDIGKPNPGRDSGDARSAAEAEFMSLLDADDAGSPHWYRCVADAAIRAGAACYDSHNVTDLGPNGWKAWAQANDGA